VFEKYLLKAGGNSQIRTKYNYNEREIGQLKKVKALPEHIIFKNVSAGYTFEEDDLRKFT